MCALMSAATHSKKKRLEGLLSGQDLLQSEWSNALRELLAVWAGGGSEWAGSFFFEWGGFLVSCSCCLCRLLVQACARSPSSSSPAPFSQIIMSCGSLTRTRFRSQMKPLSLLSPNINTKGSTIGLTPATCRAASRSSSASTLGCRVLNALLSAC